jgi:hypothetical protein
MAISLNPSISVDCVVFGFDDTEGLKVLLINRDEGDIQETKRLKLPGNLIIIKERLQQSANRVLQELTGIKDIFLKQFGVFDNPERLRNGEDLSWLREKTNIQVERVITVAFYSLVKLGQYSETELSRAFNATWYKVNHVPELIFDHNDILLKGLEAMRKEFLTEPLCFELLPKKFTMNQLQHLSEAILGFNLDNRNFRKRINRLGYIVPLNEHQKDVAHKPARYYMFDRVEFDNQKKEHTGFIV